MYFWKSIKQPLTNSSPTLAPQPPLKFFVCFCRVRLSKGQAHLQVVPYLWRLAWIPSHPWSLIAKDVSCKAPPVSFSKTISTHSPAKSETCSKKEIFVCIYKWSLLVSFHFHTFTSGRRFTLSVAQKSNPSNLILSMICVIYSYLWWGNCVVLAHPSSQKSSNWHHLEKVLWEVLWE